METATTISVDPAQEWTPADGWAVYSRQTPAGPALLEGAWETWDQADTQAKQVWREQAPYSAWCQPHYRNTLARLDARIHPGLEVDSASAADVGEAKYQARGLQPVTGAAKSAICANLLRQAGLV